MKQAEKSKITRDRIINAAVKEFGTKSYDSASLNNICIDNNISKGLIYHNFNSKDDIYLCCVKLCFSEITVFLSEIKYDNHDFRISLKNLLDKRYEFFKENPYFCNIFFGTVLNPPMHLIDKIKEIRKEFDNFNIRLYKKIISSVQLRNGISESEALEYFLVLQEMFNGYFEKKAVQYTDFNTLIEAHETKLSKILNLMLYGIAKENCDDRTDN